jgi:type II secretory ATPase GspE/PulE/Tfp pilus assembly ATPase PilB-like protein
VEHYGVACVEKLLDMAVSKGVSDIHIEPSVGDARVRMRFDGMLLQTERIDSFLVDQVVARLKVLGGMNVSQKRLPQDGKFIYTWHSKSIDIRLSSFPCVLGEKVVIRILDAANKIIDIDSIGFDHLLAAQIKKILTLPAGFFIVTGPTGSGKTTTLYAMLQYLNNESSNIVTLEDPVEYTLPGVTQTQINSDIGFTFDIGMRSLLRQDPDIILIGEIRDKQTAKTAIEAAMTGHLVFTTMHTVDALAAIIRLINMGIEPYLLEGALTGILAQRLVRKLCDLCKAEAQPTEGQKLFLKTATIALVVAWQKVGCVACGMTGYKGRIGVLEYVPAISSIKKAIIQNVRAQDLRLIAQKEGFVLLHMAAKNLIEQGLTTIDECIRVMATLAM